MDKTETVFAVFGVVMVALLVWFIFAVFAAVKEEATLPCSAFASYAAKDVPARCISYYQGGR